MSIFERLSPNYYNINEEVKKLVKKAIEFKSKECRKCEKLKEGCNAQEYEALEFIINEIINNTNANLIYSITKKEGLKTIQPTAMVHFVKGISMYPSVKEGDILIITAPYKINKGDIILFYEPKTKTRIIHRIIGKDDNFLYIQGDNSQEHIDRILDDMIIGKVSAIIKKEENPETYNFLVKAICEVK